MNALLWVNMNFYLRRAEVQLSGSLNLQHFTLEALINIEHTSLFTKFCASPTKHRTEGLEISFILEGYVSWKIKEIFFFSLIAFCTFMFEHLLSIKI